MDSTEVCRNCKREIPSVNYVMHVAHCSRNLEICQDCGEPVHTSLQEEHRKEYHETVKCGLCGKEVIRSKLEDHVENSCLEKLVECTTCGIEVPFTKLNDHELYCRSRTERCEQCQKYVMIKDLESHVCKDYRNTSKHSEEIQETVTIPCELCGQQVNAVELEIHQSNCSGLEDDVQIIDDRAPSNSPQNRDISKVQYNMVTEDQETSDGIHTNDDNSIYALPCEFCNELCPSDKLYAHQSACTGNNNMVDDDDNDDNNHLEYINDRQRPARPHVPSGPCVSVRRFDPFNMARFHEFVFGSVFNSMMRDSQTGHYEAFDNDPWQMYFNR